MKKVVQSKYLIIFIATLFLGLMSFVQVREIKSDIVYPASETLSIKQVDTSITNQLYFERLEAFAVARKIALYYPVVSGGKTPTFTFGKGENLSKLKQSYVVGGYYDLLAVKSDALVAGREFPIVGQKTVGQFFKKNQEVTLSPNAEVELVPSQFDKITVVNNEIRLTDSGNYLIGKQFPAGDYELSLAGPVTVRDSVQLIVQTFRNR
ncbi:MAG: hypothetical protein L0I12_02590 [Lactococcus sp.]|nr:hypothetical protein [Lactococcus sp.]